MRTRTIRLVVCACLFFGACVARPVVTIKSPDGRFVAEVRDQPCIDGPCQSIWVGEVDGELRRIRKLGEDSDWCDTIVWSADGSIAAFLIQGARLVSVEVATGRVVSDLWLTEWRGEYPPTHVVTDLSLSSDGRRAQFRDCRRPRGRSTSAADCVTTARVIRSAV